MQITLLIIGKTEEPEIAALVKKYLKRLSHYARLEVKYLIPKKLKGKRTIIAQQKEEEHLFLTEIQPTDQLILLDERGQCLSSEGFAQFIQKQLLSGKKRLVFCIGGAYGFSENLHLQAHKKLALSKMTFTHQMVRLIFVEQLYRGFTILKGEKYHH
jgi:23S rRNA (pseudouridine1915-N3)-methyltransferase